MPPHALLQPRQISGLLPRIILTPQKFPRPWRHLSDLFLPSRKIVPRVEAIGKRLSLFTSLLFGKFDVLQRRDGIFSLHMAFCTPCNRGFKDDKALAMHLQDSRAHQESTIETTTTAVSPALVWKCVRCDTDFGSRDELKLHTLVSEKHFVCQNCVENGEWQDFFTKRALKSHIWKMHRDDAVGLDGESVGGNKVEVKNGNKKNKSKKKKKKQNKAKETDSTSTKRRETPLDRFFTSFAGFAYDAHLSPEASFRSLKRYQGWGNTKRPGPGKDAWEGYQKALVEEVEMWFGHENDLTAWWTLCKAVGCYDPPDDIQKCTAILRNTHVNIVDLINWRREGGDEEPAEDQVPSVVVFKSVQELKEYTVKTGKVFPMKEVEDYNGGNVVLRHLLRRFFMGGRERS